MVSVIWPAGKVTCPHCGSDRVGSFSGKRRLCNCKACKKQFSVKVNTIFEKSPLGLDKWLPAVWLISCAKNGVSSCELARSLGVTQKSAWFMGHRIRLALQRGSFASLSSTVYEADETFIGGKVKNMSLARRKARSGTGPTGKTPVMGILRRTTPDSPSQVVAEVLPFITREGLLSRARKHIPEGSEVHTDSASHYRQLRSFYIHRSVDHAQTYVDNGVHTNTLECFWNLLKRSLGGTYTFCWPRHLHRYVAEQVYRFNERKEDDQRRFLTAMEQVTGKRLTYQKLITPERVP